VSASAVTAFHFLLFDKYNMHALRIFCIPVALACLLPLSAGGEELASDYPITPILPSEIEIADGFWRGRLETNRKITIPYDFRKCEETGRIANFAIAAGLVDGKHEGFWFNDSDVFKVIEGAAYSLALHPDPELEKYLDQLIVKIAAAQEDDGYLYTIRTIHGDQLFRLQRYTGKTRWSHLEHSHELYNVGHLYEAAVAYYQATGKRTLLDVAIKNANLIHRLFGEGAGQKIDVPGHQEIEIGLVKLYRTTGDVRFLQLAKFFLDHRGVPEGRKENRVYGEYWQDHQPVIEQTEAVGHAVRAAYMYSGMADVAALTGETAYIEAINRLWENVVGKKMYLTGGIGARHHEEAFGENYELPNGSAYNETCAAIGNAMWNHRMFLLHGDSKYIDVLERVLYNGFLAGISLDGDEFFYPNPLSSDMKYPFNKGSIARKGWFDCSCCPVNIVRFLPAIAGYIYAKRGSDLYVNLFVPGEGTLELNGQKVRLEQQTRYPWDGDLRIAVDPEMPLTFTLKIRIPGWALGQCVPSDLYRYEDPTAERVILKVNGQAVPLSLEKGYASVMRNWQTGDLVQLELPMRVRRVLANERIAADRGRVAIERGPLVYCLEDVDNEGRLEEVILPDDAALAARFDSDLLGGMVLLDGTGRFARRSADGAWGTEAMPLLFVPYYAWNHRGAGKMVVWLPRDLATLHAASQPKQK
jgi:DUF1680 family protein